jgi:hypothetical protein
MKIKNNRKNFVALQLNDGFRKVIQKLKPSETVDLPFLKDMKQVVNKFLFTNGNLSVVKPTEIAPKVESPKAKKTTTKNKTSKKSKVEKAIAKADEFITGDVNNDGVVDGEDLSIVHKAYSKANKKNKKEEK